MFSIKIVNRMGEYLTLRARVYVCKSNTIVSLRDSGHLIMHLDESVYVCLFLYDDQKRNISMNLCTIGLAVPNKRAAGALDKKYL